ncbi:MAG: AraC family transcriptional regulator [Lachnospiraceae bacterium]|nr:AraC family transcriptional regulator [Lachnospiraceae bacterium]
MADFFDHFPDSYVSNSKRIIATPSALAKSSFLYLQETGYLKLKVSHTSRRKHLDSYLIVLILSGNGILEYQKKRYILKKGDCFFIDCNSSYLLQSSMADPWELYWIHFKGINAKEYLNQFEACSPVVLSLSDFSSVQNAFMQLLTINSHKDSYTELLTHKYITDIVTLILTSKRLDAPALETEMLTKLNSIQTYLSEHFMEKISLDQLSTLFFMSKYHLCHEYKNYYGFTINEYIMEKRISLAKRLLRFSDKTIYEIAKECGFYDGSYFNKCFKNAEGVSAKKYREQWV